MSMSFLVGTFHELVSRKLTAHTSYAADWILHETIPGDYPVYLTFEGGFTIPMPKGLGYTLKTRITDGAYYSGFGGVNYHETKVEPQDSVYPVYGCSSSARILIEDGRLELLPEWSWLNQEYSQIIRYVNDKGMTWETLKALPGAYYGGL